MPRKLSLTTDIATDHAGAAANQVERSAHPNEGGAGEEVSRLAYEYWLARGGPDGSSEEDWFRAEQALQDTVRTQH